MKCINCGHKTKPGTTSFKFKTIPPIEIQYLEAYTCSQCGEIYLTRSSMKKIDSVEEKLKEATEIRWESVST